MALIEKLTALGDAIREQTGKTGLLTLDDMTVAIGNMSNISGTNFNVVGSTTAPANPSENTIWVNTNVGIPSWTFSSTQPTAPTEGMVWFVVSTSSVVEFNALKENSIQVYPVRAKQYVSGTWKSVEVKCYQNNKWNGISFWIIGNGANAQSLTGGFVGNSNQAVFNSNGTVTFNHAAYTSVDTPYVYSQKAFDVSGYTKMTVKVTSSSGDGSRYIGLNTPSNLGNWAASRTSVSGAGTYEVSIPSSWTKAHIEANFLYEGGTIVVSELYFS